ncbi:hypothetical protein Q5752_002708 [Cryptotrichosporon argae]
MPDLAALPEAPLDQREPSAPASTPSASSAPSTPAAGIHTHASAIPLPLPAATSADPGAPAERPKRYLSRAEIEWKKFEDAGGMPRGYAYTVRVGTKNGVPVKPELNFTQLARLVINCSPLKRLTLNQIYLAFEERWPWFKTCDTKWRNSLRHSLSMSQSFQNIPRPPGKGGNSAGKGGWWVVTDDNVFRRGGRPQLPTPNRNSQPTLIDGVPSYPRLPSAIGAPPDIDRPGHGDPHSHASGAGTSSQQQHPVDASTMSMVPQSARVPFPSATYLPPIVPNSQSAYRPFPPPSANPRLPPTSAPRHTFDQILTTQPGSYNFHAYLSGPPDSHTSTSTMSLPSLQRDQPTSASLDWSHTTSHYPSTSAPSTSAPYSDEPRASAGPTSNTSTLPPMVNAPGCTSTSRKRSFDAGADLSQYNAIQNVGRVLPLELGGRALHQHWPDPLDKRRKTDSGRRVSDAHGAASSLATSGRMGSAELGAFNPGAQESMQLPSITDMFGVWQAR